MRLITAIIQPFMLDRLARVLRQQNISGYTATEVNGSGNDLINSAKYLEPRVKVEIGVVDEEVQTVVDAIVKTVSTHQEGDGIIFVTPILEAINIQTGKTGKAALLPVRDKKL